MHHKHLLEHFARWYGPDSGSKGLGVGPEILHFSQFPSDPDGADLGPRQEALL